MHGRKYKQGLFNPTNPKKYMGNVNNIVYRSGYELHLFQFLDKNPAILKWASEELIIRYFCPIHKRWRRYFPDVFAKMKTKDGVKDVIIEVKPYAQTQKPQPRTAKRKKPKKRFLEEMATYKINTAKWAFAKEFCKKKNMDFMIITEYHLGIK
jgi:hypothetical protein